MRLITHRLQTTLGEGESEGGEGGEGPLLCASGSWQQGATTSRLLTRQLPP